jgi:MoxR-like ATPase
LWIDYPSLTKELEIVQRRLPDINAQLAEQLCRFVEALRIKDLDKRPGVSETLDWACALVELHADHLDPEIATATLGCVTKTRRDLDAVKHQLTEILAATTNA